MEIKISMILHTYLEDVLGSAIKVRVLRLLFRFPTKGFGIRELARFIGANHRSVASTVRSLRDHNLVHLRVTGRSYLVYLNRESFLSQQLFSIFREEIDSPAFLITFIRRSLPLRKIKLCALFGSVVEKKEKPASDIDLLIITSQKKEIASAVAALQEKTLYWLGNSLSPLVVTQKHFRALHPSLKENIMKNHIVVYGKWQIPGR